MIKGLQMEEPDDLLALTLMGGFEADFLLSILNASQDCVKLLEPDGAMAFMNKNGMCTMEVDAFDAIAGRPWPDMWPEMMRPRLRAALEQARAGHRISFEAECPTAKGTLKWWHVSVLPIRSAGGGVHKILASSRDVTERVLREREQQAYAAALERELAEKSELLAQRDFLMREVDHRVKNSLAQVASILRLQARRATETVRPALEEAAQRVAAIARVHEQLQSSDDFRTIPVVPLLQRLCAEFSLSLDRSIPFAADPAADLSMLSERASALSIILGELVANAVRHGIAAEPVAVHLQMTGATTAALTVTNAANGPKTTRADAAAGLGTTICETYAATLDGKLGWHFADGKVTARLDFTPGQNECLR